MKGMSRRRAIAISAGATLAATTGVGRARAAVPAGAIRIERVRTAFQEHRYRTPYKFGGVPVDRATILDVEVDTIGADGRGVTGFASMPLGNVWSFPTRTLPYDVTLGAMKGLAGRLEAIVAGCTEVAHPLELARILEPEFAKAAAEESAARSLAEPIPPLAVLVTASAFDAALHDAGGKALGRSAFLTLTPDLIGHDLSRYLGDDFRNENLQDSIRPAPAPRVPLFHSVGGADPVRASEIKERLDDGLPQALADWIRFNDLIRIKIKLQGEDLEWDIERTLAIDGEARATKPDTEWKYCADFNERCPNVEYVLEYLRKVEEKSPACFAAIEYVEQPTSRNLRALPRVDMHAANKLRPIVVDEGLVDLESLLEARALGYTGLALKACKGQSHSVLFAAAARKYGMFLTVQDLTCPGAALVHSAGIAAWVPGTAGLEANARQYMPEANEPWEEKLPGLFKITDGMLHTDCLAGRPGLGAV
jgi:L-alanine-DL-glutamate epimerase-like enolase superfamily enzyme